jgi:hypothetical protein
MAPAGRRVMLAALVLLASARRAAGSLASAWTLLESGLAGAREVNNMWPLGEALLRLGEVEIELGLYDAARAHLTESLEVHSLTHKETTALLDRLPSAG